jgi:hypothetical protein
MKTKTFANVGDAARGARLFAMVASAPDVYIVSLLYTSSRTNGNADQY